MEILIIICQLIVIALLLHDKIVINWRMQHKPTEEKVRSNLPNIMGHPKPLRSQSVPNTAEESPMQEQEINPDNLDIEYDENEIVGIQIPQEELVTEITSLPNLEEEEEEWIKYGISSSDNSLAQGVTYNELSTVDLWLQNDNLEENQVNTAEALVRKIQGTELLRLLENTIEGASQA